MILSGIWRIMYYRKEENMFKRPTISVIVPCYNSERTVEHCLASIITGHAGLDMEVVCVNDGSTDGTGECLRRMSRVNRQISVVTHERNRGLFQARITGVRHARGEYLGFVDSDDYVQPGYFTGLTGRAREDHADIVTGRIINVAVNGVQYVQPRCLDFPYCRNEEGLEPYRLYWRQAGLCYPWHVVWNKVYARRLWERGLEKLPTGREGFCMMEDFVFSSVILSGAERFGRVGDACYYYVQRDTNLTASGGDLPAWMKNISDMEFAFGCVEDFLRHNGYEEYVECLYIWKKRYSRIWTEKIITAKLPDKSREILKDFLRKALKIDSLQLPFAEDKYYYEQAEFLS